LSELKKLSSLLRKKVLTMIYRAGSGHPAGSLSCLDILIALYFGGIMRYDPRNPDWEERDRFFLSAGHACPALYAVLAKAKFFSEEKLDKLRKLGSFLQGHPEKERLPGLETSAGLLGQGLSLAVGGALIKKEAYFFVLTSDAEHQEGQVWEAVMSAAKYQLNNLINIVDRNKIQVDGVTEAIMPLESLISKYRAFGWRVIEVNGHEFGRLLTALHQAKEEKKRPSVVIARTIAGKGVSFMESNPAWHGKSLTYEEWQKAISKLP